MGRGKGVVHMARFFVLPPRLLIGQQFQEFLGSVFPGLALPRGDRADLAETLAQTAECQPGVYVVFSEDMDESLGVDECLIQNYGASHGDEVVIIRPEFCATARAATVQPLAQSAVEQHRLAKRVA